VVIRTANHGAELCQRPRQGRRGALQRRCVVTARVSLATGVAILITVDGNHSRSKIIAMLLVRITGNQLRAGRALAGLTIEDLATRAQLHRQSVRKWEGSSNAVPDAMVSHLSRALDVLEAEGVRFSDSGVYLQRPGPMAGSTVVQSAVSVAG
jgi:hypothetical protein